MHHFEHRDGVLFAEEVSVTELAQTYGTPLYIYSAATFRRHFKAFDSAFDELDHLTCYSVKANYNLSVLRMLAEEGAGMDIVSGGELYRALKAGVDPKKIVYSGVGKRESEILEALAAGILMFNVESVAELIKINEVAGRKGASRRRWASASTRTWIRRRIPYISTGMAKNKFGLDIDNSFEAYKLAAELENIDPVGMDCHIGSQLTSIDPFLEALDKLLNFYNKLKGIGIEIKYLDLGGGLGIPYDEEEPAPPDRVRPGPERTAQGRSPQGHPGAGPRHCGQRRRHDHRGGLHQHPTPPKIFS